MDVVSRRGKQRRAPPEGEALATLIQGMDGLLYRLQSLGTTSFYDPITAFDAFGNPSMICFRSAAKPHAQNFSVSASTP